MYFKRMDLHGFKSFADPVTIEFHKGITCVVGPNGSGKSNISDAIRWVLGEQSPKMLRGGKMEEVIFAGTASRKSRGMAEVTLVIDNEQGTLPIDYNEVAITRRMFRSGESEYSINSNPCRLKDIRELIMDTGIGVDGYSLIGQGKISDIISNKTESRREIFEEAAGIVMYRTRKAESEKKLTSTSANLERINDIISEIEGRIDGLREESLKASEYLKLRERNRELEINIALHNMEELEKRNKEMQEDIFRLSEKLETCTQQRGTMEKQLLKIKQKTEQLQNSLEETREQRIRCLEEINRLSGRGNLNRERLRAIEKEKKRLKEEQAALKSKLESEKQSAEALSKEYMLAESRQQEADSRLQEKLREQSGLTADLEQVSQMAEQCKEEIYEIHSSLSGKKTEAASLENLRQTLERRRLQLTEEKSGSEKKNREMLDQFNRLRSENESLEAEWKEKLEELTEKETEQKQLSDKKAETVKALEELRLHLGQQTVRQKTIREMESNYEGYHYGVKFIMRSGLPGIYGTVAELITVPRDYEIAIETALGAALQNIVCADDRSAQQAIERLKEKKAGRLTFLPVSSIRGGGSRTPVQMEQAPGFQGFGTDCIRFDKKYENVFQYLLGRVALVDTMEHAVALSKKAAGIRFVTLEGEVINAGGAITGGRYKNKTANFLERKGEIAQLEEKLRQGEKHQEQLRQEDTRLGEALEKKKEEILSLQEGCRHLEMKIFAGKNELEAVEQTIEARRENTGRWDQELENIRMEQGTSRTMAQELEEKIRQLQEEMNEKEGLAQKYMDLRDQAKETAVRLREEITEIRLQAGSCESEKNSTRQMEQRVKGSIAELLAELTEKEKQASELETEKEGLQMSHTDTELLVNVQEEKKEQLERRLEELSEERKQETECGHKLGQEKEALEQQMEALRSQKYEMEIKSAKNETQLSGYKEKLWDDFEISYIQAMDYKKQDFAASAAVKENKRIRNRMKELGEVNTGSIKEYETVSERYEFLTKQRADVLESADSLSRIIRDMDKTIKERFRETFDQVVLYFEEVFAQLFGGGHAQLRLDNEKEPLESGIEIIAQPPGKKLQNINLLSGGEKTMTAIALMFAVLKTKPTPFCILDEVEAALDDANIERFAKYLKNFEGIQFTLVTHQKATMEHADVLYGVTMPEQGVSKVLSLRLGEHFEI